MTTEECAICGNSVPFDTTTHVLVNPKHEEEIADHYICRPCYVEHLEGLFAAMEEDVAILRDEEDERVEEDEREDESERDEEAQQDETATKDDPSTGDDAENDGETAGAEAEPVDRG